MTRAERESHLFTRREFLNIFSGHLEVVSRKWDRETTEEFTIYDTDVDYMSIRYSGYSARENFKEAKIREIFIITWDGGWDHLKSYIKIEWHYNDTGYVIETLFREPGSNAQLSVKSEKQNKDDILRHLINFFHFIEPNKTISLQRDVKIKQIFNND